MFLILITQIFASFFIEKYKIKKINSLEAFKTAIKSWKPEKISADFAGYSFIQNNGCISENMN